MITLQEMIYMTKMNTTSLMTNVFIRSVKMTYTVFLALNRAVMDTTSAEMYTRIDLS